MYPIYTNQSNDALFGGINTSLIPATMLNDQVTSEDDFGTVLAKGIKGAAVNAINGLIGGAYSSGQLQNAGAVQVQATNNQTSLIVLAVVAYLIFADK